MTKRRCQTGGWSSLAKDSCDRLMVFCLVYICSLKRSCQSNSRNTQNSFMRRRRPWEDWGALWKKWKRRRRKSPISYWM